MVSSLTISIHESRAYVGHGGKLEVHLSEQRHGTVEYQWRVVSGRGQVLDYGHDLTLPLPVDHRHAMLVLLDRLAHDGEKFGAWQLGVPGDGDFATNLATARWAWLHKHTIEEASAELCHQLTDDPAPDADVLDVTDLDHFIGRVVNDPDADCREALEHVHRCIDGSEELDAFFKPDPMATYGGQPCPHRPHWRDCPECNPVADNADA